MWIIPKQLIVSSGFTATEGIISDSSELSQVCARSLLVRSKPTRWQTWSQKWKRDSWTHFLSGRIVRLSRAKNFTDWWISSLRRTPAKASPAPVSKQVLKTLASYGLGVSGQLQLFNLATVSSRTSKGTSRMDSPQLSAIWKKRVTEWRQDYSRRLNAVRHSVVNESSSSESWPTPVANDDNKTPEAHLAMKERMGGNRTAITSLNCKVKSVEWPTPNVPNGGRKLDPETAANKGMRPDGTKAQVGLENAVDLWATPSAHERTQTPRAVDHGIQLANQVQPKWGTPRVATNNGAPSPQCTGKGSRLEDQVGSWPTPRASESENRTTRNAPSHGVTHGKTLAGEVCGLARPTPKASEATKSPDDTNRDSPCLSHVVKNWPTPNVPRENSTGHMKEMGGCHNPLRSSGPDSSQVQNNPSTNGSPRESLKLSADWVEALMDVPQMWTDCGCSETESIQPPPQKLLSLSTND